jgi:predicted HTH transcriptional regulator
MNTEHIQQIIATGENTSIEFKECKTALNKDVYETVCAFLNRAGGEILLGVKNNGEIVGIAQDKIDQIQKEFVTTINNANKLVPPTYLTIEQVIINGFDVLYIYVPPSSQVHRVNNRIFERNQVVAENSNRPHFHGVINPANFSLFPKNPIISAFFREIGRAEALGSGVRNLFRYTKIYSAGIEPQLIEDNIFKIIIPLDERLFMDDGLVSAQVTAQDEDEYLVQILLFCQTPKTRDEIQEHIKIAHREYFRKHILKPLLLSNKLLLTIPDKPTSPKQKYYTNPPEVIK